MVRKKLVYTCLVLLGLPILILFFLLLFTEWAWGGQLQSSLEPHLIPTAEYLMQDLSPNPPWLTIYPFAGGVYSSSENITLAVQIRPNMGTGDDVKKWTRIFVNGKRISSSMYGIASCGLVTEDMREEWCFVFTPHLERGLHLIRIQVGSSIGALLNPDPAYSYEWAYRVE
ncbi:MAG: hypothetical protein K8L97_32395 [Anaerolineae bacterium]|nr:hypothetical protein [Anaerolineae bacterium]